MKEKLKKIINIICLFFNNIKIRNKLIITYLIVAVSTVSIVCIYLTKRMNEIVVNRAISGAEENVNVMQYRLEELMNLTIRVSDMIYGDQRLAEMLTKKYEGTAEIVQAYEDYSILSTYLSYYRELTNITMYVENDTLLSSSCIYKVTDQIKNKDWYKEAIDSDGRVFWKYGKNELSDNSYLSLVRAIKDSKGQLVGVLVIDITKANLRAITNNDPRNIIAIDGNIISLRDNLNLELADESIYEIKKQLYSDKNYVLKSNFDKEKSYIVVNSFEVEKSTKNTFQTITILPEEGIISQTDNVMINSFSVALATVIFSLLIIIFFSKSISKRVDLLSNEMHRVVNGDFYVVEKIYGNDEIGQLYNDLNVMVTSIRNLINQVYIQTIQEEKLKASQKEVEFKMLSSQINPHFLYNTLETIRMKAFCNGEKEIADIVKKLGKIMRRNLEVSGKPVSLKSELDLISDYLEIQSMRFEGMVNYEIIVDKNIDINDYMILPLLLQPVVENAFVHGLEEKKEKGTILINLYNEKDNLYINVEDNGIGMNKNELEKLVRSLEMNNDEGKSIGMKNVNQRIKLHYGNNYGIQIESNVNIGTKVIIILPIGGEKEC